LQRAGSLILAHFEGPEVQQWFKLHYLSLISFIVENQLIIRKVGCKWEKCGARLFATLSEASGILLTQVWRCPSSSP
jgi:hypothetical protein